MRDQSLEWDSSRTSAVWLLAIGLIACSSASDTTRAPGSTGNNTKTGMSGAASGVTAGTTGGALPGGVVPSATPGAAGISAPMTPVDAGPPCVNLQCQRHSCSGGGSTTISGSVYDPAGRNPLSNIAVYVPNEPVQALKTGASCDSCSSLYTGMPVAAATTDASGKFMMMNAPDGKNIPLVIQIGKWRKQITLPSVNQCKDNPVNKLTLPKNHMEGDIPNIAISTGGADTLECLLRRIGVDGSEYMAGDAGPGRLHIFQGTDRGAGGGTGQHAVPNTSPSAPLANQALWDTGDHIVGYDIVLLSCEGQETQGMNQDVLHDYASIGGRVFASHFHYSWFNTGPYGNENLATWTTGSNSIDNIDATIVTTLANGQPFPKGMALEAWLKGVGALTNAGKLHIDQARHNADVAAANRPSTSWIIADQNSKAPGATQYFSFNTPTDAQMAADGPAYCGRVVYSDLHVGGATQDNPNMPVPDECLDRALSPQEAALEYMLFDLSSCLTPDDRKPPPPIVVVQ